MTTTEIRSSWKKVLKLLQSEDSFATVEELRLHRIITKFPDLLTPLDDWIQSFAQALEVSDEELHDIVNTRAQELIDTLAQNRSISHPVVDDRPIYWGRLMGQVLLRQRLQQGNVDSQIAEKTHDAVEWNSRRVNYGSLDHDRNMVLTCFDPFMLDRNVTQCNPSAIIAYTIAQELGHESSVTVLVFPVRFQDFDEGCVERMLKTLYLINPNLVVTLSMGRNRFDLERFPGNRRSVETLDNLNICGNDGKNLPTCVPKAPSFLEFSLPAESMEKAQGEWSVIDNRRVATERYTEFYPRSLKQLESEIAIQGSGGGFLSNEISYRSILFQKRLGKSFPLGHLHVPKIDAFDANQLRSMCNQAAQIIKLALDYSKN